MVNLYPHNFTPPHFLIYFLYFLNFFLVKKQTHLDNTFFTFTFFLLLLTLLLSCLLIHLKSAQASYLLVNTKFPLCGIEIQPLFFLTFYFILEYN